MGKKKKLSQWILEPLSDAVHFTALFTAVVITGQEVGDHSGLRSIEGSTNRLECAL